MLSLEDDRSGGREERRGGEGGRGEGGRRGGGVIVTVWRPSTEHAYFHSIASRNYGLTSGETPSRHF